MTRRNISHIDLLLIGKTGNGKSALGNSVLKRIAFESKSSCESVTKDLAFEYSEYKDRVLKVVDGPGVGDTSMDTPEAVKLVVEAMKNAIAENPRGYHAFLLVVRFGGRFTKEDIATVDLLKSIFGKDFVRKFCILVFTYGDEFERQMKKSKSNQTFDQWCKEQEGVISQLLKECDNRYVLFDNMTEDEQKQDAQIDRLLELVDGLQSQGNRYTDDNFKRAQVERDRAVVASKEPVFREEVIQETSLIMQKLEEIKTEYQAEQQIPHLRKLETRCGDFTKYLQEQDKGTGALGDLIKRLTLTTQLVRNLIEVRTGMEKELKEMKESQKQNKADMQKEIDKLEKKHKKRLEETQKLLDDNRKELQKVYNEAKQRSKVQKSVVRINVNFSF